MLIYYKLECIEQYNTYYDAYNTKASQFLYSNHSQQRGKINYLTSAVDIP